jgi:hypothetical protein
MKTETKPKIYLVLDKTNTEYICMGTLNEIQTDLENEWINKIGGEDASIVIPSFNVYELIKPIKLKYTAPKLEIK